MKYKKIYGAIFISAMLLGGTMIQGGENTDLSSVKQGKVIIEAETDFKDNHTSYPILALNEQAITLTISGLNDGDYVIVKGNEGYADTIYTYEVDKEKENPPNIEYIPEYQGVYTLSVRTKAGKIRKERKIYVKPPSNKKEYYYELSDIETVRGQVIKEEDSEEKKSGQEPVLFKTVLESEQFKYDFNQAQEHYITKYVIGEPNIQMKTIVTEPIQVVSGSKIKEGTHFDLGTGTYKVEAHVNNIHSQESQDTTATYYTRENPEGHQLDVSINPSGDGIYTAEAHCVGDDKHELLYAFLVTDYTGTHVVREYGSNNTYKLPSSYTWEHTLTVRVKHADRIDLVEDTGNGVYLDNSYEAVASIALGKKREKLIDSVHLQTSDVDKYMRDKDKRVAMGDVQKVAIDGGEPAGELNALGREKNYITVNASSASGYHLEYKAWVIDDGCYRSLGDYSENNQFMLYPFSGFKEGEEQTLVVSVQARDASGTVVGGEEGRITVNIIDKE